jgi:hydrogenase expression/formation protein HypC
MCLAIPEKIIRINKASATVRTGSIEHDIDIMFLPGSKVGDYVLVHAGFALQKIDEYEAKRTLSLVDEYRAKGKA